MKAELSMGGLAIFVGDNGHEISLNRDDAIKLLDELPALIMQMPSPSQHFTDDQLSMLSRKDKQ